MKNNNVQISDIAGYGLEKKELLDIADSFNKYKEYLDKGIDIPRGLLLVGDPGTGKTLFARVLANEAKVPFYEFKANLSMIQTGSFKLKRVFNKARKSAPAIIFIDEIDRYINNGYSTSDSSNRFLVTLLTLIDGFASSKGVMFIGATSEEDDIPDPLKRSGRMDIKIHFSKPDRNDRLKIINYYLSQIGFKKNVSVELLAFKTTGFSGADLKNMVYTSARKAKADKKEILNTEDFYPAISSILEYDIYRNIAKEDIDKVASNEVALLLVSKLLLGFSDDIAIDSTRNNLESMITSRFLEGIRDVEDDDDYDEYIDYEEKDNSNAICPIKGCDVLLLVATTLLSIKAIQEINYSTSFSDSESSINKAKIIIKKLCDIGYYGFDYIDYEFNSNRPSSKERERIENKISSVLDECYKQVKEVLNSNMDIFIELKTTLLENNFLTVEDSNAIFAKYKKGKKKEEKKR